MKINIIAAVAQNYAIGKNNNLLWHISEDLKRFKKITSGKTVVMGRKTYESLPVKPLPERRNIILTSKKIKYENAETSESIEQIWELCKNETEIFICGGAEIYKQFLPFTHKLYITFVHEKFEADTFFQLPDLNQWEKIFESPVLTDIRSGLKYNFTDFAKKV